MDNLSKLLLRPINIRGIPLKNRVAMAPMTQCKSFNNRISDDNISYYIKRAKGGVGLIITEGLAINNTSAHGYPHVPTVGKKEDKKLWKKLTKTVKKEGSKIFAQLWHVGSLKNIKGPVIAPSSIAHPYFLSEKGRVPKEMFLDDIEKTIEEFIKGALYCREVGFDGVELHAAHGYLVDQFFWKKTNFRRDQYGCNSAANQTRFACEIVKGIRALLPEFPISLRISEWKLGDFEAKLNNNPKELEEFLNPLILAGVDLFDCSTHKYYNPLYKNSSLSYPGWVKKLSGLKTMVAGCVGLDVTLEETWRGKNFQQSNFSILEEKLLKKEFDIIGVGRPLLSDPDWAYKFIYNKRDQIIPFDRSDMP